MTVAAGETFDSVGLLFIPSRAVDLFKLRVHFLYSDVRYVGLSYQVCHWGHGDTAAACAAGLGQDPGGGLNSSGGGWYRYTSLKHCLG